MYVGIDFGTTNSAVAIADDARRRSQLVPLAGASYWRTVLYFEPGGGLTAGAPAIARYLETEGEGRLVQSIKSHLASAAFTTHVDLRPALAARRHDRGVPAADPRRVADRPRHALRDRPAGALLGRRDRRGRRPRGRRACATRSARPASTRSCSSTSRSAPPRATRRTLDHDELIVVADFGGGTTDFSVIRVGPGRARGARDRRHRHFGRRVRCARDRCGRRARARPRHALSRRDGRRGAGAGVALRPPPALAPVVVPQGGIDAAPARARRAAARSIRSASIGSSASSKRTSACALHRAVEGAKVRLSRRDRRSHRARRDRARPAGHARGVRGRGSPTISPRSTRVLDDVLARAGVDRARRRSRVRDRRQLARARGARPARRAVRRRQRRRRRGAHERRVGPRRARARGVRLVVGEELVEHAQKPSDRRTSRSGASSQHDDFRSAIGLGLLADSGCWSPPSASTSSVGARIAGS